MTSLLSERDENTIQRYGTRMKYVCDHFGLPQDISEHIICENTILAIVRIINKRGTIYMTNGLSELRIPDLEESVRIELMCFCNKPDNIYIDLLIRLSEYPFKYNEGFWNWDTIEMSSNFSTNYTGLVFTPLSFGLDKYEYFPIGDNQYRILQVQGITSDEMLLFIKNDSERVGKKLMKQNSPWLDHIRSAITLE